MGPRPLLAMLVVLAVLPSCTSSPTPEPSTAGTPAANAADAPLLPDTTDELPEMGVEAFDELRAQVRGTPLVVNVWASWCDPCQEEGPDLAAAAAMYGDRVQFLGIDVQDNRSDAVRIYIHRFGLRYPSVFDVPGAIMSDLGIVGPPATLFYEADGSLLRSIPRGITADDLDGGIRELLA